MIVGPQRTITARQRALLQWYARYGRHRLPWRHHITPYRVFVSEVMLQQTQVDRVIPFFNAWMRRWPTVESLARAKRSDVIRAWAGLGYNRRAVYLHRAVLEIVYNPALRYPFAFSHEKAKGSAHGHDFSPSRWDGPPLRVRARGSERGRREAHGEIKRGWDATAVFSRSALRLPAPPPLTPPPRRKGRNTAYDIPRLTRVFRHLPGIGSYTANAILAFAWNLAAPCVDVNARRVLAYAIYKRPAIMNMPLAQIERLAARVIPPGQGRAWNYALMDYGALVLRAHDVPKHNRPKPTQGRFENSTRFWRGRIVAVLRGDTTILSNHPNAEQDTKKRKSTVSDGRQKLCSSSNVTFSRNVQRKEHYMYSLLYGRTKVSTSRPAGGWSVRGLRSVLRHYGDPPPLASLLAALVRDGVVVRRGQRYAFP